MDNVDFVMVVAKYNTFIHSYLYYDLYGMLIDGLL